MIRLTCLLLFIYSLNAKFNNTFGADRWVEIDLKYFHPDSIPDKTAALINRIEPLYRNVRGEKGLIICAGWLTSLATEWQGKPDQRLPIDSQIMYGWSLKNYMQLKILIAGIKEKAELKGIGDLKIGLLFVAYGKFIFPKENLLYDFDNPFAERQPDIFQSTKSPWYTPALYLDVPLLKDIYPYATFPEGIPAGTNFSDFFSSQLGSLVHFLNIDAILLRDGFPGMFRDEHVVAEKNKIINDLYAKIKLNCPKVKLMGYSGGNSFIRQLTQNELDLEELVAAGAIDAWIVQSWAGAWQDWWNNPAAGYTSQMSNILIHQAMVAAGNARRSSPCRFYTLIETWDGFEPWDILHNYPGKLKWEIWAYTHTSYIDESSLSIPDGIYVSWANNREQKLWSKDDVTFLTSHLDSACENASRMNQVYGYSLVYNRKGTLNADKEHCSSPISENIDEYAGIVMKWGLPILSSSDLNRIKSNVFKTNLWIQLPENASCLPQLKSIAKSCSVLITGKATCIDPSILQECGVRLTGSVLPIDYYKILNIPGNTLVHLPETPVLIPASGDVVYGTSQTPLLTRKGNFLFWQPPERLEHRSGVLNNSTYGSWFPFVALAGELNTLALKNRQTTIVPLAEGQPVAFHYWKCKNKVYFMFGNLESGNVGDSRLGRTVELLLSREQFEISEQQSLILRDIETGNQLLPITNSSFVIQIPPESVRICELSLN